ncbi:AAA family ATPase [Streptomyces sp. NPDC051921]|uniref:caspase family protein n=1 Tax=Streptomyces sp. NPDC051921 TaxID=3155806 RepID=UPI00342B0810
MAGDTESTTGDGDTSGAVRREPARGLVVVGVGRYDHAAELEPVPEELRSAVRLFGGLGYRLDERIDDPTAEELRSRLLDWAYRADRSATAVVLYWTGHGVEGAGRHYLLCRDSREGRLAGTAIAAEDVTRFVLESGARRVLLVIDTCHAGQGGADASAVAESLRAAVRAGAAEGRGTLTDFAVVAVARADQFAHTMAFTTALETALGRLSVSRKQRRLSVEQVVDTVNEVYRGAGLEQTARAHVETEGYAFFSFENSGYRPEARDDAHDLAELRVRLSPEGRRRRAELDNHFAPRGRGFTRAQGARTGSYFVGRTAELDRLTAWLGHRDGAWGRGVAVTGGPGVGKSALLGRLLLGAGKEVHTAIHARHRFLEDVTAGIADAAGLDGEAATAPRALLAALAARREPLHVLVDALDEAGETGEGGQSAAAADPADAPDASESRRIATELLVPLVRIPCVRLLVGTRRHVLDAFDGEFSVLDLDATLEATTADVAHYARSLLQAPDGPGSTSPYDAATAAPVAEEIAARARGAFLSARIAARALARAPRALDLADPDWRHQVPELGETPGVTFLRVLRRRLATAPPGAAERSHALLAALALAEGPGLPPDRVWRALAAACLPPGTPHEPFAWEELAQLLTFAGEHLVEELDTDGRAVYRLYHQAYADALRTTLDRDVRERAAHALHALVPERPGGGRDWSAAPPYVLRHLIEHAEGTTLLDALALDPALLLAAEPSALHRVLNRAGSGPARAAARALGHCAALLCSLDDPGTRAAQLRLSAFQTGAEALAHAVRERWPALPWDSEWAELAPVPYRTIGTFTGRVTAAAVATVHGRPVLVTAEDAGGGVRVWDGADGGPRGSLPGDFGRVRAVRTAPGRPWAALCTEGRVWLWDLETRDLIGAAEVPGVVDCALVPGGDDCVVVTVDGSGTLTAGDLRHRPRAPRSLRPVRIAVARHGSDGGLRVAVAWCHPRATPRRRALLTVTELAPDGSVVGERRHLLRGRTVSALAFRDGVLCVASEKALRWSSRGRKALATEADGLRLIEWSGRETAPALLIAAGPLCLDATSDEVLARDAAGRTVGRTPTDAAVRRLVALGDGDGDGLPVLVSWSGSAFSAKVWRLGSVAERAPAFHDWMVVGTSDGRPVVVGRRGTGVRMLDGVTGALLDEVADPDRALLVAGSTGAPVVRRTGPKGRDASLWVPGGDVPLPGQPLRRIRLLGVAPGDGAPRLLAFGDTRMDPDVWLDLRTPDGEWTGRFSLPLGRVHELRLVPTENGVLAAARGSKVYVSDAGDDGMTEFSGPFHRVVLRGLPHGEVVRHVELESGEETYDLGSWPEGPVLGIVTDDGDLTVRTRLGEAIETRTGRRGRGIKRRAHPPRVLPRPDTAPVTRLRLQTRHGRATVLTATSDGTLTLFAADTTEVLHRIFLGCEVLDLDWLDGERLCVHTTTGLLCLRLP